MDRSIAGPSGPATKRALTISPMVRLVVAVAIVALGLLSLAVYAGEYSGDKRFTKDFALDYVSAKAFLDGKDPYTPIRDLVVDYLHPPAEIAKDVLPGANWHTPFKLVVTLPLALLPYRVAGVLWLLLSAAAYVGAGVLLARGLGWRTSSGYVLGVGSLIVPVVQKDLSTGNLNGVLLLLLVAAWYFAKTRRDAFAGASIGVAVAMKVFPGLMLLPFLVARRLKVVLSAIGSAVALTAIGALALGPGRIVDYVRAGTGGEGFGYWDASPANIGWWGMATRWLSPNGWVPHADLGALGLGLALAGVVTALWLAARPHAGLSGDGFWSTAPLMLLAWPIVWDHYLVLVLPWIVIAARRVPELDRTTTLAFALVSIPLVIGLLPGGPALAELEPWRAATIFQLPTLALIGAVWLERRRSELKLRDTDLVVA